MADEQRGTVLVVEDDPQVRDLFRTYLEDRYAVLTAGTAVEAMATVSGDVDVVLLDRMLPNASGDEILGEIRSRGIECRVAMVTALEPDLDVAGLGFDDYVVKPVSKSKLHNTVDSLLHWGAYDTIVQEFFSVAQRVAVIEERLEPDALEESEEYDRLVGELEALRAESAETLETVDSVDLEWLPAPFVDDAPETDSTASSGP